MDSKKQPDPLDTDVTPDDTKFEILSDNEVILTWRPAMKKSEERKAA